MLRLTPFLFALAAGATASPAVAQAPASAQVWDVQFATDCLDAPAVGITLRARVAIAPNPSGTANFGVLRAGGADGSLLITITDPNGITPTQGIILPGLTRESAAGGSALMDTGGSALAGLFHRFRGFLAPPGTGGANADPFNGIVRSTASGSPTLTSIVSTRQGMWDQVPLGRATIGPSGLTGDYAEVFRFLYVPQVRGGTDWDPTITVTVRNLTARYIYAVSGTTISAAPAVAIPDRTFTFEVPVQPVVLRQPVGGTACPGAPFTLSARIAGLGPLQYQWYREGEPVAGAISQSLTIVGVSPASAGEYVLTAVSPCGSAITAPAMLAVEPAPPPAFVRQPADAFACFGETIALAAEVSGATGLQWLRNGEPVAGATGPTLILAARDENEGEYRLRAAWACGSVESVPARVEVNDPPRITQAPEDRLARSGETVTLAVTTVDEHPLRFEWHKDGSPQALRDGGRVSGAATATLRITDVRSTDAGAYTVFIFDPCTTAAATAILTVTTVTTEPVPLDRRHRTAATAIDFSPDDPPDPPGPPACLADFNRDGHLDADDLSDFLTVFFSGLDRRAADINRDGSTDADDLADMIGAFFAGC